MLHSWNFEIVSGILLQQHNLIIHGQTVFSFKNDRAISPRLQYWSIINYFLIRILRLCQQFIFLIKQKPQEVVLVK